MIAIATLVCPHGHKQIGAVIKYEPGQSLSRIHEMLVQLYVQQYVAQVLEVTEDTAVLAISPNAIARLSCDRCHAAMHQWRTDVKETPFQTAEEAEPLVEASIREERRTRDIHRSRN